MNMVKMHRFYMRPIQSDRREIMMIIDQWKMFFKDGGFHVKKCCRDIHILYRLMGWF